MLINLIIKIIISNLGSYCSSQHIADAINTTANNKVISYKTIDRIIDKLESCFLLSRVERLDFNKERYLATNRKYFITDLGMIGIYSSISLSNNSLKVKNIIYNELILQEYSVYILNSKERDIDFLAIKNNKKCFVQVSYYIISDNDKEREFGVFDGLNDGSPRYVMSLDSTPSNYFGINHINIIDFLTHKVYLLVS
jgi:predicted AAA+ superfamily ATPase